MTHAYKYFTFLAVFFVTVLLISNIVSTKITDLGWFVFDAGTLLFPLAYILGDVLTEVYGFAKARAVIWMGFFATFLLAFMTGIVGMLPPASDWPNQGAYEAILGATPRIVLASLIAYFLGSFVNAMILAKMKVLTAGKHLWARTIGSSVVAQGIDTVLFVTIAFWGILPNELLISIAVSNYVFKLGIEMLATPVTYRAVAFLKKKEAVDHYDRDTKFSFFHRS
ncbi:queuosine precursor transporter [Patescibacteria group bacterium]|nr:queuosine precursor transporter [Patescibacteria group bacterium]